MAYGSAYIQHPASRRLTWADAARGVAILMVVVGHSCPPDVPTAFIYACHMPLFFMLSGMFFHTDTPLWRAVGRKARTLLVPFVVFNLVMLFSDWCIVALSPNHHAPVDIPSRLLGTLFGLRSGIWSAPLWFLPCLFVAQVLMMLAQRLVWRWPWMEWPLWGLLTLAGVAWAQYVGMALPLSADVALLAVGFLLLGRYARSFRFGVQPWWFWLITLFVFVSSALDNYAALGGGHWHVDMSESRLGNVVDFYMGAVGGSMLVMGLCHRLDRPTSSFAAHAHSVWWREMFRWMGRNSLALYCLHRIPLNLGIALTNLVPALNQTTFVSQSARSLLLTLFTMLCLWPACAIVNRWLPWTLGKTSSK